MMVINFWVKVFIFFNGYHVYGICYKEIAFDKIYIEGDYACAHYLEQLQIGSDTFRLLDCKFGMLFPP